MKVATALLCLVPTLLTAQEKPTEETAEQRIERLRTLLDRINSTVAA